MLTVKQALQVATQQLGSSPDINAPLEADLLLAFALNKDRSWLFAWPEKSLTEQQQDCFFKLVEERQQGMPISYLTGEREFWGLTLKVNKHTLIPRHETELLIETALDRVPSKQAKILELGTGSGAIAIALAVEKPGWQITACDISCQAIEVAKTNANENAVNIKLIESDWFSALQHQGFDLIISNPPYIRDSDPHLEQGDLRFEPRSALASGSDGLADIRKIIQQSPSYLKQQGLLMLEHGYDQSLDIQYLLSEANWQNIQTLQDHENRDRITLATRS